MKPDTLRISGPFRCTLARSRYLRPSTTSAVLVGASVSDSSNNASRRRWSRPCAYVVLLCLAAFIAAIGASMHVYPGGNWLDRSVSGHRFFANFLCDLTQPVSLSGVDNLVGARCAQFGMLSFAVGLSAFFWVLPEHFRPSSRATRWVRGLGECAMATFVAVPLTPSERFGNVHASLALVSGALGIAAAACAVIALARSNRRAKVLAVLGTLALLVGALDAALFAHHLHDTTPPPLILPAAQKVAALLLMAWMAVTAGLLLTTPRAEATRP